MKKIVLSALSFVFVSSLSFAQNVNIPDANFKAYLVGEPSINTNSDSEIQVAEAAAFTGVIMCSSLNISDLTGIEAFTSLTELYCLDNNLSTLDFSQNVSLNVLYCNSNALTSIDISQNTSLTELAVDYNNLTSVDVSNNVSLSIFSCSHNSLTGIDVSQNLNLSELYCSYNPISSLDVSQNAGLTQLNCDNNSISALDLSQNPNLLVLLCRNNNISDLDVTQNSQLYTLRCQNNDLTSLKRLYTSTLVNLDASLNPNLTCIEVDDVSAANANLGYLIDSTSSFSSNCSLGTNEVEPGPSISVYPNPAISDLTIVGLSGSENYSIFNLQGEIVQAGSTNHSVILNGLNSGTYLLQFQNKPAVLFVKE